MLPSASAGTTLTATRRLFNAGLSIEDEQRRSLPYLAEALPRLDTETWRVDSDGRMETIYRLRPGLRWQDGEPFTAQDFVFAGRVYAWPEFGLSSSVPHTYIDEVVAPNAQTLAIRWKRAYASGGLLSDNFLPLPRHLLQDAFDQGAADGFSNHPYWTYEYVGLGPYRIERWEPGAFIDALAFQDHALGAPRIQRMRLTFIPDQNTVVANLLSDAVHIAIDGAVRYEQGAVLRREWAPSGAGVVLSWPSSGRYVYAQLRPEKARPQAVLDLRVRKALAHAIDKQALVDGLLEGEGLPDHTYISPREPYFDLVDRSAAKYPYDLRRTEQYMNEARFAKGPAGFYTSNSDGRFIPDHQVNAGAVQWLQEQAILVDTWRRAGFDMTSSQLPQAQQQDNQARTAFPTLASTASGCGTAEDALRSLTSDAIPRPENRWRGSNRGSWSSPEFDRLAEAFNTALDPTLRGQHAAPMITLMTESLPGVPLYCNVSVVAHASELAGPLAGSDWNVHLWEWRA
jgi:peptide/nickel transport system substrate-binding protein